MPVILALREAKAGDPKFQLTLVGRVRLSQGNKHRRGWWLWQRMF